MAERDPKEETGVKERTKKDVRTERPRMWKVLLHNDDYTPMDFVIAVLIEIFHKDAEEATRITLLVHHQGIGVAGLFPHAVAEAKVAQVLAAARRRQYPLQASMEPE